MGHSSSTPTDQEQIQLVSQIGYTNTATIVQNLEVHMTKTHMFLAVIIGLFILGGIIYAITKMNKCLKKEIDTRAQAIILRRREEV